MNENTITIGPVRFSYLNVTTPKIAKGSTVEKYSTAVLIPKEDKKTVDSLKLIIQRLKAEVAAKNNGKLPPGFKLPLKDGDAVDTEGDRVYDENYKGMYFFNCSANVNQRPTVVDKNRQPILVEGAPDGFYSGMWGYVNVNFFPFNNVSQGIGVGLNHIMKTKDDRPFTARVSSDEAFKGVTFEQEQEQAIELDDDLLG